METQLERLEQVEKQLALNALNTDFCHFLDYNMTEELADLFTKDARYSHGKRLSVGREEIRKLFTDRTSTRNRTSRHMQTGLKITFTGQQSAEGKSVCMTFACDGSPPISPATPFLVADFVDEYKFCDDGKWRFHKRHIERIFTAAGNTGPVGLENKM